MEKARYANFNSLPLQFSKSIARSSSGALRPRHLRRRHARDSAREQRHDGLCARARARDGCEDAIRDLGCVAGC
jgi:hypothetical protein